MQQKCTVVSSRHVLYLTSKKCIEHVDKTLVQLHIGFDIIAVYLAVFVLRLGSRVVQLVGIRPICRSRTIVLGWLHTIFRWLFLRFWFRLVDDRIAR